MAARDGFDAETSLETLQQLCKLDESLTAGAIPNATLVSIYAFFFCPIVFNYLVYRMVRMLLPSHWVYTRTSSEEGSERLSPQ
jgi:hypothetical protein